MNRLPALDGLASTPPAHRTLRSHVVDVLGSEIVAGAYGPGDALPNEADLCEALDVSRGPLREAVRTLEGKGLLEARPRTGTRVRHKSEWNHLDADLLAWRGRAADRDDFLEKLVQLRRIFEPGACALAATNGSDADIAAIGQATDALEAAIRPDGSVDERAFIAADQRFHRGIVDATQNEFIQSIGRALDVALAVSFATTVTVPGAAASTTPLHREVADAVAARDPERAQRTMLHLVETSVRDLHHQPEAR